MVNVQTGGVLYISSSGAAYPGPFTVSVAQTPAIAAGADFTEGTPGNVTVLDAGSPTPTLTESNGLPGGLAFNAATGVLSGTPAPGTAGTYTLTFTAANGIGAVATPSFLLIIEQVPDITSAGSTTFTLGMRIASRWRLPRRPTRRLPSPAPCRPASASAPPACSAVRRRLPVPMTSPSWPPTGWASWRPRASC